MSEKKKSAAIIKTDLPENWEKAINYIPDKFTIIVYEYPDAPKIKIGDGKTKVNDLAWTYSGPPSIENNTLQL